MSKSEDAELQTINEVCVTDIADILAQQHVLVTGGRSREGYPIITFPDNGLFQTLSNSNYKKLLIYVTSVLSIQDMEYGLVLVIDRSNDKWSAVKHTLYKLTEFFPGYIHVAYVIRPSSFLQKAISEVSNKFFKEEFEFKVVLVNSPQDLLQYIDSDQLTSDFKGDMPYSHQQWICQRIVLDHFAIQTKAVLTCLHEFTKCIQNMTCELPNTYEESLYKLNEQTIEYGTLKQNVLDLMKKGQNILADIRRDIEKICASSFVNNATSVERLLIDLEEADKTFDILWDIHAERLRRCLELRLFERDFTVCQSNLEEYLKEITNKVDIGDSDESVDALLEELNEFRTLSKTEIDQCEALIQKGEKMMSEHKRENCVIINEKLSTLKTLQQSLRDRIARRSEALTKSKGLQIRIKMANNWCARGIELLGSQNVEKCSMFPEHVEDALSELEQFVSGADDFNVSGSQDLYALFQESITPETKPLVTQVLQRIEDVMVMCDKRMSNLRRLIAKPNRPVQTVIPERAKPISHLNASEQSDQMKEEPVFTFTKSQYITNELLETERIYVDEIRSIITGYKDMMRDEQMKSLVPTELVNQEDALFMNLDDLESFHSSVVLPELERCILNISAIGDLFLSNSERFLQLYCHYCQNFTQSQKLREKVGEKNAFFLACQARLGHKLPVGAFMLKPVQRITKYQLLLKDLIGAIADDQATITLKLALDCMLRVLKCVNDNMHQISITAFPGRLYECGDLILQGQFSIWFENKKDLLKELRLKPMRRHVFLYRKAILLCKKSSSRTKGEYQFKGMLEMSKIGLTETVRGDTKKFEVWLSGRQEVYTFQSLSLEHKYLWVKEIKKVLFEQLAELKGETIRLYGDKQLSYKTLSSEQSSNPSAPTPSPLSSCSSRGNSRPNSHHEMTEDSSSAESDTNSEDEDEGSTGPTYRPTKGEKYVALADYCASGPNEISLKEGNALDLVKVGRPGWWFVRLQNTNEEGWIPSSYLESREKLGRKSSHCSTNSQHSQ